MDRLKYKRLWPRYIADMNDLKGKHPETWRELQEGNISVTKSSIPFVSIGADHACEMENKVMKAHNGLIGISNKGNARLRYFMATPELSCLSEEFKSQVKTNSNNRMMEHHDLRMSSVQRDHSAINKIKATILEHGNPFASDSNKLYNLITQACIPDEFVPQILDVDKKGQKLYEEYVNERINGDVSLWAPVKRVNNQMFQSGMKKSRIKLRDNTVDLKETKDLYARLMILARSNREIDLKDVVGQYEFTLTPRALFSPNGMQLICTDKSNLIHLLTKLGVTEKEKQIQNQVDTVNLDNASPLPSAFQVQSNRIAVVDGMVILQKLTVKSATMLCIKDVGKFFNESLNALTCGYDEIIVVFDTYKQDSLKSIMREKRHREMCPFNIKLEMKQILSMLR